MAHYSTGLNVQFPMRHAFAALAALLCSATSRAQEHPFLSDFTATVREDEVLLEWTMVAGTTCDGTEVERAVNGGDWQLVGGISGLCGDVNAPVAYDWTDDAPQELSTIAYRLKLGAQGWSSTQQVRFERLTVREHLAFPSPAQEHVVLLFREAGTAEGVLDVFDQAGRPVMPALNVRGERAELDVRTWPAVIHHYRATYGGRVHAGRFTVQH